MLGVGDGDLPDGWIGEISQRHLAGITRLTPQHDAPHRIGLYFGARKSLHLERARISDVGGEIEIVRRALPDLRAEFTGRAIDGFYLCRSMCALEQHDDLVQRELEIGGSGNGELFCGVRRLPRDKQANKNKHPRCKPVYIKKRDTVAASKGQSSSASLSKRFNSGIRKLYLSNK